jgi:polysaccharide transporter, PST family
MVTCGKTRRYFWWEVINAALITITFFTGIAWEPIGVASAVTVTTYLLLLPTLWYSFRDTPLNPRLFFGAIIEASFASLAMAWSSFSFLNGVERRVKILRSQYPWF